MLVIIVKYLLCIGHCGKYCEIPYNDRSLVLQELFRKITTNAKEIITNAKQYLNDK